MTAAKHPEACHLGGFKRLALAMGWLLTWSASLSVQGQAAPASAVPAAPAAAQAGASGGAQPDAGRTPAAPAAVLAGACVSLSGYLTLKGSEPGAWWALTDDQGQVWKLVSPTPQQALVLAQAQNQRVRVEALRLEKYFHFEQVQPCRIVVEPLP